jgi:hypothetical protein
MIAFHGYPSSMVENECFRRFVRGLNPHFQMPSRADVEGICHSRAKDAMKQLIGTLAGCSGQMISLATGTTENGQERALYMACQFIDDEWAFQKSITSEDMAIEGEDCDVLMWWKANSSRYPTVASMARDALAMPASDILSPEHIARIRSMMSSYCLTYPES